MDLELDESMDAFKRPKTNRKVMLMKVKLPQKRKQAPKTITKTKKTTVETVTPEMIHSCSTCGTSSTPAHDAEPFKEINNNPSTVIDFQDEDVCGENLIPTKKIRLGSQLDMEDDDEDEDYYEDSGELIPCQTCGKKLVGPELRIHTPACLRLNLEACRFASGCMDNLRCRMISDSSPVNIPSSEIGWQIDQGTAINVTYMCPTCGCDLSLLSSELRNTHVNRCFDHLKKMETSVTGKSRKTSRELSNTNELRCVICGKTFKSHSGLKKHYVSCQKKHNFTTMTALTLNRRDQGNDVSVEILEAMKRADEQQPRDADNKTDVNNVPKKKKTKTKTKSKKKMPDFEEGVFKLALAVSNGEDLGKPFGRKTKKKQDLVPVMLLQSPSTKQKVIQERLRSIINEARGEDDIPSTPTLPVSSLGNLLTRQSNSRYDVRTHSDSSDDVPHHHESAENLRDRDTREIRDVRSHSCDEHGRMFHQVPRRILQESFGEGSSHSQISPEETFSPIRPHPVVRHAEPTEQNVSSSYERGLELRNGELQSPEVSSSNMKHPSVPESRESVVTNQGFQAATSESASYSAEDDKIYTKVFLKRQKSKWTMTGSMPSKSDCFVKGLLSQFERTASPDRAPQQPSRQMNIPVYTLSESPSTSKHSVIDHGDNINSTLQNLELLEEEEDDLSEDSVQSGSSNQNLSTNGNNIDAGAQMCYWEDAQGYIRKKENLDNLKLPFSQAFLSELYSDAHIVLESFNKVFPLHKIILHCRCPKLLEEIRQCDESNLFMKDVSEEEIIPIISHIYTGEFGKVPKTEEKVVKLCSLLRRFGLPIPDSISLIVSHIGTPKKDVFCYEPYADEVHHTIKPTVPFLVSSEPRNLVSLPCHSKPGNEDLDDDDIHEFLSQPSPTQKSSAKSSSEDPGTSGGHRRGKKGSEQGYHSDNDMFDFSQFSSTSSLQGLDDATVEPGLDNFVKDGPSANLPLPQFEDDLLLSTSGLDANHIDMMMLSSNCMLVREPGSEESENQRSFLYYSSLDDSIFSNFENDDDCIMPVRECSSQGDGVQIGKKTTKSRKNPSQPKERTRRKRSSSVGESSKTAKKMNKLPKPSIETEKLYVSERLPRFKQREHIKNRPGVANMGKNVSSRSLRGSKKEGLASTLRTKSASKEISSKKPVRSPESETTGCIENEGKNYKFKKTALTRKLCNYAAPSPSSDRTQQSETEKECRESFDISDISSNGSDYDNFFGDSFEDSVSKTLLAKNSVILPLPDSNPPWDFKLPNSPRKDRKSPVLIPMTPMPNFSDMETPEVLRQGQKIGLKKRIGKTKIKKKLKEVFMYNHQVASSDEEVSDLDTKEGRSPQENDKISEDDLEEDIGEIKKWKLELSRLSASPRIFQNSLSFPKMYSFERLSTEEIQLLSSSVVQRMHMDKTLLSALLEAQGATGSIKRGSRQDQKRCWDIVTPGSQGYDPKLNAILRLSEEYQSAIMTPLITCVVDNYIEYKRYMFECLPVLCDRMESEMVQ